MDTRHNLAYFTGLAGDAVGARDQFTALLPIVERAQGVEHPETLNTRHNLARWTGNAGDVVGARDRFAALLPIRERIHGGIRWDDLHRRRPANLRTTLGDLTELRASIAQVGVPVAIAENPTYMGLTCANGAWLARAVTVPS